MYKRKRSSRKGSRKTLVSKRIKKYVKRELSRQVETKTKQYSYDTTLANYYNNGLAWSAGNVIPLGPFTLFAQISQGTGQGDRIGNQIRTKRCYIKYVIYPSATSPLPQDVRMIVLSPKELPTTLVSSTNVMPQFFQNGSSYQAPTGTLVDMTREINKEYVRVYVDRIIKVGYARTDVTTSFNNDYKANIVGRLDVTKYLAKVVKFADNLAQPVTKLVQIIFLPVNYDGSSTDVNPLKMSYTVNYDYEDA